MVYQDVTRNKNLMPAAKGLYAYLASFCGDEDECFPSVDLILKEMGFSRDTFYKHVNALVAAGVVEKKQLNQNGRFGRTVYKITHEVTILDLSNTNSSTTEETTARNSTTNNNSINNNSINNNRGNIDYQRIADMYNDTCVSFPRLTVLSEKRKKTIRARLNTYTVEDFKRLFEMAESSSFLKGQNARNWSATFDWLITDSNMAKVLDGNYIDRQKAAGSTEQPTEDRCADGWEPDYFKGMNTYISPEEDIFCGGSK